MGFAGELSTIGLPEVFQNVAFNRLTGVMTVVERERQACIYFKNGVVRAMRADSDRSFDYADIVARAGAVSGDALREAGKRRLRRTLREAVSQHATFDEARFDDAIETAVREELVLLFGWKHASFVFEETRPEDGQFDEEQLACNLALDPQSIAVEAARRVDEWEAIGNYIDSERDIFLPVAGLPEDSAPAVRRLLDLLDGTRDLRQILGELPLGRFHVLRMVADLAERGFVVRATAEQLRELSTRAEEEGEIHLAVGHLESALELTPGDAKSRQTLVRLYERSGRRNEAAREYKRLARSHERKGDLDGALAFFEHAIALVPYDVAALERVVEIHDSRAEREEFMRAGMRLGEALNSQRLHEDALDIYRRLLEQDPQSVLLREAVAATLVKLHEPKMAAQELMLLARSAAAEGQFARAAHYYRNVLAVDRDCDEARERIGELDAGKRRRQRRVRRRRIASVILTLALGLLVWQGAREWESRGALHEAARATFSRIAQGDGAGDSLVAAIESHASIVHRYPRTTGAREAEETVRTLLTDVLALVRKLAVDEPAAVAPLLERIGGVRLPEGVLPFWNRARDHFLTTFESRLPSEDDRDGGDVGAANGE